MSEQNVVENAVKKSWMRIKATQVTPQVVLCIKCDAEFEILLQEEMCTHQWT